MGAAFPEARLTARRYAETLLGAPLRAPDLPDEHPARAWARCGLMALTGRADGPSLMCPVPIAACADGVIGALCSLAPTLQGLRGSDLLAERAAIFGYTRQGAVSPGGSCRLLEASDGWIAVNLARPEDWELVPAWVGEGGADWDFVSRRVRRCRAGILIERAREIGLAGALVSLPCEAGKGRGGGGNSRSVAPPPQPSPEGRGGGSPFVVDLSSLWAGPLCGHLLHLAGAEVIKVESTRRPDGARRGPAAFFDLLNAGKRCIALDFATPQGRAELRALIEQADIVIEASRPRALRQLGFDAEALVRERPGLTWVSITAHGRDPVHEHWIGYGDDAAVAAGLTEVLHQASGERVIVGDAIADPLAGMHAALWALQSQGGVIDVSLSGVVRRCIDFEPALDWLARQAEWAALAGEVEAPRARTAC